MKKLFLWFCAGMLMVVGSSGSQELAQLKLNPPNLKRGLPFMETLSVKASVREFSDRELSLTDLSDLLWAANGLNRPAEKKTTASSAMNAHDVDIFVFMKAGVYIYDWSNHKLDPVISGDFRAQIIPTRPPRPADTAKPETIKPPAAPPIEIILIADTERFQRGEKAQHLEWGAIDAGIISQNISLFCAATGLKTCPRASMERELIRNLLKLKDSQHVLLDHPVGYAK